MEKRRDIELFKKVIQFYSITGTFPFSQKWKKFIMVLYYLGGVIFFYKEHTNYMKLLHVSSLTLVISFATVLAMVAFSFLCLKNAFVEEKLWTEFFNCVDTFDFSMKEYIFEGSSYKYYSKFFISNVIFIVTYLLLFPYFLGVTFEPQRVIGFSYGILIHIQLVVIALSLEKVFKIFEKRYEVFKTHTKATFLNYKKNENIWNGQQLCASHLLLLNITNKVNNLYGTKILIILFIAFADVNGSFNFLLLESWHGNYVRMLNLFGILGHMFFTTVSTPYFF